MPVGLSGVMNTDGKPLSFFAELFSSLLHGLQTFSLDEDYSGYLDGGITVMKALFGDRSFMVGFYTALDIIISVLCPVTGGAVVLHAASSVFPRFQLFVKKIVRWRELIVFSELNEGSLKLAENIQKKNNTLIRRIFSPIIVFAGCGGGDEGKGRDLSTRTSGIGAVCLKGDRMITSARS